MQSLKKLNPLKLAKQAKEPYSTLPLHESDARRRDWHTNEKHGHSDEDYSDYDSEYSTTSTPDSGSLASRNTSGSFDSKQPMLKRKLVARTMTSDHKYRMPRRVVQGFCWSMIFVVIGFILFLIRMSHLSSKNLMEHKPVMVPQWESFEFLTRYYGGIRTLLPASENDPEYPRPEDEGLTNATTSEVRDDKIHAVPTSKTWDAYWELNSTSYISEYGAVQECFLDDQKTMRIPGLHYYAGRPSGFPENVMGSYDVLGLPEDVCFERYGRLGPYGHGYGLHQGGAGTGQHGDREGADAVWETVAKVDYRKVNWAFAQKACLESNKARFSVSSEEPATSIVWPGNGLLSQDKNSTAQASATDDVKAHKKTIPRTAVVVRTWDTFEYSEEDIMYLRTLIMELSLGSGAEYDVHLLVQVKDTNAPVWADREAHDAHLKKSVPQEFWGIATLWSETQNALFYSGLEETWARGSDIPVHGVYRGLTMAMQYFAVNHPQYDYFWQWEMDIRYTGHYYSLFKQFDQWSTAQPRKGLWERNGRFYIPSLHGSWEDFTHTVRVQTEQGQESPSNVWAGVDSLKASSSTLQADKPIWGPERPVTSDQFETDDDPTPPTTYIKDKYNWGVEEPADLITLNPIFDPEGTTWGLASDATGYNKTDGFPPRRAAIITASRMSRKLLHKMHRETAFAKHHAFPEMWPATVALHHGYKAVYVPHPVYIDREWPVPYLGAVFNAGRNGASGGSRTSIYGDREHNFRGTTWFYNAGFAGNLWRRWLGLRVDNEGGEEFETIGKGSVEEGASGVPAMMGGEGRMCLPPMLLHPVKGVELPVEKKKAQVEGKEFDPSD